MAKMTQPGRLDISLDELNALLDRLEQHKLTSTDYPLIADLIRSMAWLSKTLENQTLTIHRLKKLFGFNTERTSSLPGMESEHGNKNKQNKNKGSGPDDQKDKKKRKGKRFSANDYKSAKIVKIAHQSLKAGYRCPACKKGNLRLVDPGIFIRVLGQPWLQAYIYELEKLRCNTCGKTFTAKLPEDIARAPKYDAAAKAIVALLKYRGGFPFYRQESLQMMLETPISDNVLWEMTNDVSKALEPIFQTFILEASKGECLHNDDTKARILDLISENKTKKDDERTGIFTSAILSKLSGTEIALFFTGRQHAGENLDDVLDNRPKGMPTPTQMCDASNNNAPKSNKTEEANCLAHLRRKFYEIAEIWPTYVLPIIADLNKLFSYEREAKTKELDEESLFKMHQEQSTPIMNKLKRYCEALINEKKTEPNSNLGKAIKYMLNHWEGFTLFLRKPRTPLDNNADERLMKRAVLNRKNGLFFKTEYGAYVGDVLLSCIETCQLNNINPYPYFIAVQTYQELVGKDPKRWLPWKYKDTLAELGLDPPDESPKYKD
jgi:transposase